MPMKMRHEHMQMYCIHVVFTFATWKKEYFRIATQKKQFLPVTSQYLLSVSLSLCISVNIYIHIYIYINNKREFTYTMYKSIYIYIHKYKYTRMQAWNIHIWFQLQNMHGIGSLKPLQTTAISYVIVAKSIKKLLLIKQNCGSYKVTYRSRCICACTEANLWIKQSRT